MNHTSKWAMGLSLAAVSILAVGNGAIAQENGVIIVEIEDVDGVTRPRAQVDARIFPYVAETLGDRAVDTFYTNDQNYYDNRSIGRQILWFFGLSHTENEVNQDGRLISQFTQDAWHEQASSTATIRTIDLPNPYTSSLLLDPTIPEQQFPPTSIRQPIAPPTVVADPEVTPGPVRALW
ncbi:MAG: hypothetical protein F6K30_02920 [Cyanothece sp. SIO2G6]|nr:hypothetical protein [Cyanothece sp. SIO2G6]